MQGLELLNLSNNRLTSISCTAFFGLNSIVKIDLRLNEMESMERLELLTAFTRNGSL